MRINMRTYVSVLLVSTVLILVISCCLFIANRANDVVVDDEFQLYWKEQLLKAQNPVIVYQQFVNAYQNESHATKHAIAHIFGDIAYDLYGDETFFICDSSFDFGCQHEALGRHIQEHGIDIEGLNKICGIHTWCQHGIGHGLVAHYGYDLPALEQSINICKDLLKIDPVDGCIGGIFMEYTLQTMHTETPFKPRDYVANGITMLCADQAVADWAREACYFWSGQWVLAIGSGDDAYEQVDLALRECYQIADKHNQQTCIKGVGYGMPFHYQSIDKVALLCERAHMKVDTTQCLAAAAAGYATTGAISVYQSLQLCASIEDSNQKNYCEQSAQNISLRHIANYSESMTY